MVTQIVVVVVCHLACEADERPLERRVLWWRAAMSSHRRLSSRLGVEQLLEMVSGSVQGGPDVAELSNGTKRTPLEFIEKVAEGIGTLDKVWCLNFHGKLYLRSDKIVEFDINQNIVSTLIKSILDPNNLKSLRRLHTYLLQLVIHSQNLSLLRWDLASQQVADREGDQVWRRFPPCLVFAAFVEAFGDWD